MLKNLISSHMPSYLLFLEDSQSIEIKNKYFGSLVARQELEKHKPRSIGPSNISIILVTQNGSHPE